MSKRPKLDIASVLAPERMDALASPHGGASPSSRASTPRRSRASVRTRQPANTEILHVYMPAELKERFRRIQAQLQLDRGETWKLSEIARAVLTLGLEAGEDEIIQSLDQARV